MIIMGFRVWQTLVHGGSTALSLLSQTIIPPPLMARRNSGPSVVSLSTISMRVFCAILPLMVASIACLSTQLQPVFLSSLEVADQTTNLLGFLFESIFLPSLPSGNFLPEPKCKGAFMFDFDWMLMDVQSTCFLSTTLTYTICKMEKGIHCFQEKGCRRCVGTSLNTVP
jgi:hypothetical protein